MKKIYDCCLNLYDFKDEHTIYESKYIRLIISSKKVSPYQNYLFKSFKFNCTDPSQQKIVIETFYKHSHLKCQYLKCYDGYFYYFQKVDLKGGFLYPTFSKKYFPNSTLEAVIKDPDFLKNWKMHNVMNCLFAVAEGIKFLHDHLFVHGNLCPSNVIVDDAKQCYLCDFGLYSIKKLYMNADEISNKDYRDPSLGINQRPTRKSDIYSYGVLMCQFCLIFYKFGNKKLNVREFLDSNDPNKYSFFPPFFSDLIPRCLSLAEENRPSIKQIIELFQSDEYKIEGYSINKKYQKFIGKKYIVELANKGDIYAIGKLAKMYETGDGIKKNTKLAFEKYKETVEYNNSEIEANYGVFLQKGKYKDLSKSVFYLRSSADSNNVHGMAQYGIAFKDGIGIDVNIEKAKDLLKKSADYGCSFAQINYAAILLSNNPSADDVDVALCYLRMAIDQDDPEAYFFYGTLLLSGIAIEKNISLAMDYIKVAADLGLVKAMLKYADSFFNGKIVPENHDVALKYYKMAADKGSKEALNGIKAVISAGKLPSTSLVIQTAELKLKKRSNSNQKMTSDNSDNEYNENDKSEIMSNISCFSTDSRPSDTSALAPSNNDTSPTPSASLNAPSKSSAPSADSVDQQKDKQSSSSRFEKKKAPDFSTTFSLLNLNEIIRSPFVSTSKPNQNEPSITTESTFPGFSMLNEKTHPSSTKAEAVQQQPKSSEKSQSSLNSAAKQPENAPKAPQSIQPQQVLDNRSVRDQPQGNVSPSPKTAQGTSLNTPSAKAAFNSTASTQETPIRAPSTQAAFTTTVNKTSSAQGASKNNVAQGTPMKASSAQEAFTNTVNKASSAQGVSTNDVAQRTPMKASSAQGALASTVSTQGASMKASSWQSVTAKTASKPSLQQEVSPRESVPQAASPANQNENSAHSDSLKDSDSSSEVEIIERPHESPSFSLIKSIRPGGNIPAQPSMKRKLSDEQLARFKASADNNGDGYSMLIYGQNASDPNVGHLYIEKAYKAGYRDADLEYANDFFSGHGVGQDYQKAAEIFALAYQKNTKNYPILFYLIECYQHFNYVEALKYVHILADLNVHGIINEINNAQLQYGIELFYGKKIKKDVNEAIRYITMSKRIPLIKDKYPDIYNVMFPNS